MKIKKFNESSNIDNDEIEMMFYEYLDSGSIEIKDKYLLYDKVMDITPYIKDPSKVRHCKVVSILVGKGTGIELREGKCMVDFLLIESIIKQLKRFYKLNNEDINFLIFSDYMGLSIKFIIKGEYIKPEDSRYKDVDKYLQELKDIITYKVKYRIKIDGNWLDMGGKDSDTYHSYLYKIKNGIYNRDHVLYAQSTTIKNLVDWYTRVTSDNLKIDIGGGDKQLVVKLENN